MRTKVFLISLFLFGTNVIYDTALNSQTTDVVVAGVIKEQSALMLSIHAQDEISRKAEAVNANANAIKQIGFLENLINTHEKVKVMMQDAKKKLGVIKNFESYKKIYSLIEAMACTTKEYTLYASLSNNSDDCFFKFNNELAQANINLSKDLVVGIGIVGSMTQESRVKGLDMIIERLEKANNIMNKLNKSVKYNLREEFIKSQNTRYIEEYDFVSDELECSMN